MTTATLSLDEITAAQSQKEVTANNAIAQLEGCIAKEVSILISTTDPVVLVQATNSDRYIFFTLDDHGTPPVADFDLEFPAVARGLVYIQNNTSYTATIKITGTSPVSPPTLATTEAGLFMVTSDDVYEAGSAGGGGASDFVSLSDTPANFTGSGLKIARVNTGETAIEFSPAYYDIGSSFGGAPGSLAIVLGFVASKAIDFPASLTNSVVIATTAATAQADFDVQKNGVSQGTIRFAAAGTTATYVSISAFSLASGDRLDIVAPSSADATLANLYLNLVATRGD